MGNEKKYIRLTGNRVDSLAELVDEYVSAPKNTPMIDFYASNGRLWCIKASEVEIITEKEFFLERLLGKGIFKDNES